MKKMLSLLLMLCLTASLIIVHAEPSITVAGELLYSQDFEGTVEGAFTTTNGGHMIYSVIEQDGNHFLYGNANGLYGISGLFGPTVADSVFKADISQVGASSPNGTNFSLAFRVKQLQGNYYRNMINYHDVLCYDFENKAYSTDADPVRDRLSLSFSSGGAKTDAMVFGAMAEEETGVLESAQYFSSDVKSFERNFGGNFYRLTGSAIGDQMTATLSTLAGEQLQKLSCTTGDIDSDQQNAEGQFALTAFSSMFYLDNIKVMAPLTISGFSAKTDSATAGLSVPVSFTLTETGGQLLQPDTARYEYDPTAVKIDAANGTVTPLKLGMHTVSVYLDDLYSDNSLTAQFTITGVETLSIDVEEPNLVLGGKTNFRVLSGQQDVTGDILASGTAGLEILDNTITATQSGLQTLTVTVDGQAYTVPIAVNDPTEAVSVKGSTPVFERGFEEDSIQAEFIDGYYVGASTSGSVEVVEDGQAGNKVLRINGSGTIIRTPQFGPEENLEDYVLEYDFKTGQTSGNSYQGFGAIMRASGGQSVRGYRFPFMTAIKYDETTHKVGGSDPHIRMAVGIARSNGSDNAGTGYYFGAMGEGTGIQSNQKYFHLENSINGSVLTSTLSDIDTGAIYSKISTNLEDVDYNENGEPQSTITEGRTAFASHGAQVYIDNLKIYKYEDIKEIRVDYETTGDGNTYSYTVAGVLADGQEVSVPSEMLRVTTSGQVSATADTFTLSNGIGYVAIEYVDPAGLVKAKVIKETTDATEEFTVVSFGFINPDGSDLSMLTGGSGAYAQAVLRRETLQGTVPEVLLALYDFETGQMLTSTLVKAEAVQGIGDTIRLVAKIKLPEEIGSVYAKAFLWADGSLIPLLTPIEL